MSNTGARATDCAMNSSSCAEGGNWATKHFSGDTVNSINNGSLKHHLDIDYWFTKAASSLTISNVRMFGGQSFVNACRVASPIYNED